MEDKRIYVDKLFSIMGLWKKKALIMKNHIFSFWGTAGSI